jgi:hypothetical protein
MENQIIERAKEALQPINYEPHYPGYFVKMNDVDQGGSDFCEKCIEQAVKDARKWHKEQREIIINKHKKALASGKYTEAQIKKSQRSQLKYYPKKAVFTSEGHDPDFGGGLQEPCTCEGCGEPFQCAFEANKEEAEHLLRIVEGGELSERDKWEFDVALYHFQYLKPEVQGILLRAATVFLSTQAKNVL